MKSLITAFLSVALISLSLFAVLIYAARHSNVADKERSIRQECLDKDGLMIPRTYLCIKNDSIIKLESLK